MLAPTTFHSQTMSGFRGRGGGGDRGGGRGGRGGFRGGRGGFGGGPREPEAPPATVVELGEFVHACEGEMVCKNINEKVRKGAGILLKHLLLWRAWRHHTGYAGLGSPSVCTCVRRRRR